MQLLLENGAGVTITSSSFNGYLSYGIDIQQRQDQIYTR